MYTSLHSPLLLLPPKHPQTPFLLPISTPPTYTGLRINHPLLSKTRTRTLTLTPPYLLPIHASSLPFPSSPSPSPLLPPSIPSSSSSSSVVVVAAGRSKKAKKGGGGGGGGGGRIEGGGDVRREAKANARRRSRRLAENLFYRRRKLAAATSGNSADSFTEEELQMIGLGYDRSVRFMSGPDDPNLRHPHDWHKYGSFGPYSWRGVVVGPPIRGRFSDDRVSLIGEVRDHDEWERIEQFDMATQFSRRLADLDASVGFRYFWVFVRHPKWRPTELPWQQWTLVAEVAVEAGMQQRIDKWSLMGRLGNQTRAMITQCAAWMRPDVIYVKRPVYQCRFEPQDCFFRPLGPLLDPDTESDYVFELDGAPCTYFGGLCRMVRISPKAYVDDVVNAYERLSEDAKSRCLEFLLTNHPSELLHPYTKEWKVKLEEMELGCDAPDENESDDETQITDWIEDDEETNGGDDDDDDDDDEGDNEVIDVGAEEDAEEEEEEVERDPEESEEYWNEQWKKAMRSSEEMEKLVKRSMEVSTEYYKRQMREKKEREERMREEKAASVAVVEPEQSKAEWESEGYKSRKRRVKSRIPPELFLRAAVRPFTYRNLMKEIVLMRHAIIDGDISGKGWSK